MFPGYLTILLASDFYYIFFVAALPWKLSLVVNFPRNFAIRGGSGERYIAPLYHESKLAMSIRRKRRKRRKVIKNISKEALSNKKHNQQFQKTHFNKIALDSTKLTIFHLFRLFELAL